MGKIVPRNDLASRRKQHMQQVELRCCTVNYLTVALHDPRPCIKNQVVYRQVRSLRLRRLTAPQYSADSCEQFFAGKWLRDIIVGARFQAGHSVTYRPSCCKQSRLDFRANKAWSFHKYTLTLAGELLNATDHANYFLLGEDPMRIQSVSDYTAQEKKSLPILPAVSLSIEF
jgi:hypothetical protein